MTAFTPDVIGVVNDETVDGSQRVDERGTTNNTHIINHGQQNVHGGVSNGRLIIQPLTEEDRQFMTGAFPPVR